ncbi:hypothetical protein BGX24_011275 [Mortierella sp. AD032]|nr:hypothetical protein BGX24_011275 [Mortierella sp. AD032]
MKFGKALESYAEAMPEKWRPYVIRYEALKKKINAIVQELDDRDLESPAIESLLSPSIPADVQHKEYLMNGYAIPPEQRNDETMETLATSDMLFQTLVIALMADTAFFDQLVEEVSQLSKLLQAIKLESESKVEGLGKILAVVSSPYNKDMYLWREILKIYWDAQVFVGEQELSRSTRSSERAQGQLQWCMTEMKRRELALDFKQEKSRVAFTNFFQLNCELIMMKQFKELNKSAIARVLNAHDKRTNLIPSSEFLKHLQHEPFYNNCISKAITYTTRLPEPIRLECSHVFCVRCLVKAQRKNKLHCPICRHPNSILNARGINLDVSMMKFMRLYFPKEVKEKQIESNREQAAEEMEAVTGLRWTEAPTPAYGIM